MQRCKFKGLTCSANGCVYGKSIKANSSLSFSLIRTPHIHTHTHPAHTHAHMHRWPIKPSDIIIACCIYTQEPIIIHRHSLHPPLPLCDLSLIAVHLQLPPRTLIHRTIHPHSLSIHLAIHLCELSIYAIYDFICSCISICICICACICSCIYGSICSCIRICSRT